MTTTPDLWRSPFLDNTTTDANQDNGVVAPTAGNEFYAVWHDTLPFGGGQGDNIVAAKFDSLGNLLIDQVNLSSTFVTQDAINPAAVRLPIAGQADGLAVALQLNSDGVLPQSIILERRDAELRAFPFFQNAEITIDDSGAADHPSITSFSDGSLWVSYTLHNSATASDILAQRVDNTGALVGGPITLFDATLTLADNSDLATLVNGNVVAVFQTGPTSFHDVRFTIKTPTGENVVSPTFVAGGAGDEDERFPHVAALADGGFVVTWTDQLGLDIRAAVYDANGDLVHATLVNVFNQTGEQFAQDVTALPDGGFIVAWEDITAGVDRAQRFDEAGNLVGTPFVWNSPATSDINAATYSDGRAILTTSVVSTGLDVQTSIWDSRITDANQTTGANFFGPGGSPGDILLIRDIGVESRQLEAIQTNGTATVFDTVDPDQHFVGAGDFNHDGLSDLLINVDSPAAGTRTFLIDQMNPGGVQAQFNIGATGLDWIVDGIGDFNNSGTSDILLHRDAGGTRTLEVLVIDNNAVQSAPTLGVVGTDWQVDGIGDFNHDGTSDILQHRIDLNTGSMTLRDLSISNNAVQSAPTLGVVGNNWQVDGTGDFNGDGTSDILLHLDSGGVRTLEVLTVQNNAVTSATILGQIGANISVDGIGDFNGDGTSDISLHVDVGTTRDHLIYNVVNNTVVTPHSIGLTGIDWHVA